MYALGKRFGRVARPRWASLPSRMMKDESGAVAMLFGLMFMILIMFVGASVDISRWLRARTQTWQALDAAVLAGARSLQLNPGNDTMAAATAQRFYSENVKRRQYLAIDTISFAVTDQETAISVTGAAAIPTIFLNMIGIPKLSLFNLSSTLLPKSKLAVGGNGEADVEIALMLDITGSMAGQKLTDLKTAAKNLIDIVVWRDQSAYTSRVALVPFSQTVNVGSTYAATVRGTPSATKSVTTTSWNGTQTTNYQLTNCVSERTGASAYTDAPPGASAFVGAVYTSNGTCVPSQTIVPLTNDAEALKSAIDGYAATGSTAGHLGTAWAWYMLSPRWSSVWPAASRPGAYDLTTTMNRFGNPRLRKIAVLMTDGEYNIQYCDGLSTSSTSCATGLGSSTSQAAQLCDGIKASGITVFTVGFQVTSASRDFLRTCASGDGNYYDATDGAALNQAFTDIALKISSLYLTQ